MTKVFQAEILRLRDPGEDHKGTQVALIRALGLRTVKIGKLQRLRRNVGQALKSCELCTTP